MPSTQPSLHFPSEINNTNGHMSYAAFVLYCNPNESHAAVLDIPGPLASQKTRISRDQQCSFASVSMPLTLGHDLDWTVRTNATHIIPAVQKMTCQSK